MTHNQTEFAKVQEAKRANLENEAETRRHNKFMEGVEVAKVAVSGINALKPGVTAKFNSLPSGTDMRPKTFKTKKQAGANDPEWYKTNPSLYEQVGKLAFSNVAGRHYIVDDQISGSLTEDCNIEGAGIAVIRFTPTIGGAVSRLSQGSNPSLISTPAQISAQQAYTANRKTNSGAKNYDPSDQLWYELAVGHAYSFLAHIIRGVSLVQTYNGRNRLYLNTLCRALGYDFDSYANNIADAIKAINVRIVRLNAFPMRSNFTYLTRQLWMNGNIFKDSDTKKAQLYAFRMDMLYTYEEEEGAGYLKAHPRGNFSTANQSAAPDYDAVHTYIQDLAILDTMIEKLAASEDVGTIGGDLLKAFSDPTNKMLHGLKYEFPLLTGVDALTPVYSTEVLEQIHNLTIASVASTYSNTIENLATYYSMRQDARGIIYHGANLAAIWDPAGDVVIDYQYGFITGRIQDSNLRPNIMVLNSREEDPSVDTVIVDTRLKPVLDFIGSGATRGQIVAACGTEIVLNVDIHGVVDTGDQSYNFSRSAFSDANTSAFAAELAMISQFDWFPIMLVRGKINDTTYKAWLFGDLNNFTILEPTWLKRAHEVCLYSELGVKFSD